MNANPETHEQDEPQKSIIINREQLNHVRKYLKDLVLVKYTEDEIPTDPSVLNKLKPATEQVVNELNNE